MSETVRYNVPLWLNAVALRMREFANDTRIVRDDTNSERTFTAEEHAAFLRWIEAAERMEDEANAILRDWTALPGEKS